MEMLWLQLTFLVLLAAHMQHVGGGRGSRADVVRSERAVQGEVRKTFSVLQWRDSPMHQISVDNPSCSSANCRLELSYAHQSKIEMVPLMMQKDYQAK